MPQLPLTIEVAAIPAGRYTPQELAELIAERLTISTEVAFALFRMGTTVPTSDEGLFYNQLENIWMRWDNTTGTYVEVSASDETLGYILQVDDGNNANDPDPDIFKVWVVLNGAGESIDIRTYNDGDWRSFLKGTANAPLAYSTTGEGVVAVDPANQWAVLASNGASAAPAFKYAGFEPGDIKWSGRANPRTGWLRCDGSAVDRTTYADLFTEISTTFGAGNGSTTFNLPNLPGRVVVTAGAGAGLTNRTVAQEGGEETHVLSEAELPAHTHPLSEQTFTDDIDGGSNKTWLIPGSGRATGSTGNGDAHNTMQPFIVLNAYIYTGV